MIKPLSSTLPLHSRLRGDSIKKKTNKTIWIAAGSSGGHIIPALQVAKRWLQQNSDGHLLVFTSNKSGDATICKDYHFITKTIHLSLPPFSSTVSSNVVSHYVRFFWHLLKETVRCFLLAGHHRPDRVVTTGGFIALPVVIAAWLRRCPIDVYELNVVPGKVLRAVLFFATHIYVVFEKTKEYLKRYANKCIKTSYPLRFVPADRVTDKTDLMSKMSSKQKYAFSSQRKTVFLMGGSQGSESLNTLLFRWLSNNTQLHDHIQIIHQTGGHHVPGSIGMTWQAWYEKQQIPARVFDYSSSIVPYYLLADVVISRAGAGTLFELAFFRRKSIIIPLRAVTTDHQVANAYEMNKRYSNLFWVVDEVDGTQQYEAMSTYLAQELAS